MRHRDYHYHLKHREHHPQVGIGLFFIVLGLALLVATNDLHETCLATPAMANGTLFFRTRGKLIAVGAGSGARD